MKTVMFYVLSFILAVILVWIVLKNREIPNGLLLSLDTYYSLIENEEIMEVPIFVNQMKHPITHKNSYLSLSLTNQNKSKILDVSLIDIFFVEEAHYLNQTFFKFILIIDLPYLGYDYFISDLFLEISLNNLDVYHIEIGRLSIYYPENQVDYLEWSALSGLKNDHHVISRLKTIFVDYETLTMEIEKIEIGIQLDADFEVNKNQIVITIPDDFYFLNQVPIIITFINQDVQIIDMFHYFNEYQILSKNGILVNTYALN